MDLDCSTSSKPTYCRRGIVALTLFTWTLPKPTDEMNENRDLIKEGVKSERLSGLCLNAISIGFISNDQILVNIYTIRANPNDSPLNP